MDISEKHKKIIILSIVAFGTLSFIAFVATWKFIFFVGWLIIMMGALAVNNFILYR